MTGEKEVLTDLTSGRYDNALEVIAFNPTEGWSRNVTETVAAELQRRANLAGDDVPRFVIEFVERNFGENAKSCCGWHDVAGPTLLVIPE